LKKLVEHSNLEHVFLIGRRNSICISTISSYDNEVSSK